jgi:hypothetical protein
MRWFDVRANIQRAQVKAVLPKCVRPRTKRSDLAWFQSRFRMQDSVGERRHSFVLSLVADASQAVACVFRARLGLPIVKVHMPAALVNVVGNHP